MSDSSTDDSKGTAKKRRCPECDCLTVWRGECNHCGHSLEDDPEIATDGGIEPNTRTQSPASRLREAIKQIRIVREDRFLQVGDRHHHDEMLEKIELELRGLAESYEEEEEREPPRPAPDVSTNSEGSQ
jgi:hypothetical protein